MVIFHSYVSLPEGKTFYNTTPLIKDISKTYQQLTVLKAI